MSMNICVFNGTCIKPPKMLRSQQGDTYAVFTISVRNRIKDTKTDKYVDSVSVIDCALFGEKRCRFLCNTLKTGMRVVVNTYYMPTEVRGSDGKIKMVPMFVVDDWVPFEEEKEDKWHSESWY